MITDFTQLYYNGAIPVAFDKSNQTDYLENNCIFHQAEQNIIRNYNPWFAYDNNKWSIVKMEILVGGPSDNEYSYRGKEYMVDEDFANFKKNYPYVFELLDGLVSKLTQKM